MWWNKNMGILFMTLPVIVIVVSFPVGMNLFVWVAGAMVYLTGILMILYDDD